MSQVPTALPAGLRPGIPAWAMMTPPRLAHVLRVAELAWQWGLAMGVAGPERDRWLRAVWLHDALRDAPVKELDRLVPGDPGPLELRHGPAAAARAEAEGERDQGILGAVRYHSIGHPDWDMVGRVLYCADYLEPGRSFDREERSALAGRFASDPGQVLREVARRRMAWLVSSGWEIPEPTWRFWNSVTGTGDR